jgi:uncharacterized protein (TIGR03437 family)
MRSSFTPRASIAAAFLLFGALPAMLAQTPELWGPGYNPIDAGGPTLELAVHGKNFLNGATVFWGATPLQTVFVDSGKLMVTLPAALTAVAGDFSITVKNPNGAVSRTVTVNLSPVLLAAGPPVPRSSQSAVVTVTGRGFGPSSGIWLAVGLPRGLLTTYINSSTLTGIVPADMTSTSAQARVRVMGPGNTSSRDVLLNIGTPPVLTSLTPSETVIDGPGLTLTLTGSGFLPGASARWGTNRLPTVFVSSTQLRASIDAALLRRSSTGMNRGASIDVINPDNGLSTFLPFFVRENVPTISRLDPPSVYAGAPSFTLNVSGTGYYSGSRVKLQGQALTTELVSSTQLRAAVPEALLARAIRASVTVVNGESIIDAGTSSIGFGFPIEPPALDGVTPPSVKAGGGAFTLTANGAGFFKGHSIHWSGSPLATSYLSPTQLSATIDASRFTTPGPVDITVVSAGGATSNRVAFRIEALPPAVSSLSPAAVPMGSATFLLTVRGGNFTFDSVAQWNGSALPTSFIGPTELAATVAASLVARRAAAAVTVSSPGGVSAPLPFTVTAALPTVSTGGAVNAFSGQPAIAPGSLVTIYGSNLAARQEAAEEYPLPPTLGGASVTINGRAARLLYAGPNQINLQAPYELEAGPGVVVVDAAGAQSAQVPIAIAAAAPGILATPEAAHAVALNYPGGERNSASAPARPGSYIIAYATGQGAVEPAMATGHAAPESPLFAPTAPVRATIGGVPAEVAFAGLAPGFAGLLQINVKVPDVGPGEQIFQVTIGDALSNATVLSIGDADAPDERDAARIAGAI